jgi:hypothetical protein
MFANDERWKMWEEAFLILLKVMSHHFHPYIHQSCRMQTYPFTYQSIQPLANEATWIRLPLASLFIRISLRM